MLSCRNTPPSVATARASPGPQSGDATYRYFDVLAVLIVSCSCTFLEKANGGIPACADVEPIDDIVRGQPANDQKLCKNEGR